MRRVRKTNLKRVPRDARELTQNRERKVEDKRQRLMAHTLARLHAKLENKDELYKLHIKHYHMTPENFRRRTGYLMIPEKIYKLTTK